MTVFPTLLGISMVLFFMIHLAPGGPKAVYALEGVSTEDLERIQQSLGLDDPIHIQYIKWLSGMIQGDWGNSYKDGRSVTVTIFERIPATLTLMAGALFLTLIISIPLGVYSATRARKFERYSINVLSLIGISIPTFWTGLMVILIFSRDLGWIPSGGIATIGVPFSIQDRLLHLIAPAAVLASVNIARWTRYVHGSMSEVMRTDFVRTARAKGQREWAVIIKYAFGNTIVKIIRYQLSEIFQYQYTHQRILPSHQQSFLMKPPISLSHI
jgi:peptide/nickel transport system permease protein